MRMNGQMEKLSDQYTLILRTFCVNAENILFLHEVPLNITR